jgi:hypothetical protein
MGARSNWIAVASTAHVRIGRGQGFMQVNQAALLKRMTPGSRGAYDSPIITYGGSDRLQAFAALGVVKARGSFPCDMDGFHSFRREVQWLETNRRTDPAIARAYGVFDRRTELGEKFRYGLLLDQRALYERNR